MNKKIKIYLLVFVYILSLLPGCINNNGKYAYYNLTLKLIPHENETKYYVIIPFLVHEDNQSKFNSKVLGKMFDSNINIKVQETYYGHGLNITFNYPINLSIKGKPNNEMFYYQLSMTNNSFLKGHKYYWLFSSFNGTITYIFDAENERIGSGFLIESNLTIGWQVIKSEIWNTTLS